MKLDESTTEIIRAAQAQIAHNQTIINYTLQGFINGRGLKGKWTLNPETCELTKVKPPKKVV